MPYQIAIARHGVTADNFVNYIQTSSGVPKILAQSGFGPLPGDPQ